MNSKKESKIKNVFYFSVYPFRFRDTAFFALEALRVSRAVLFKHNSAQSSCEKQLHMTGKTNSQAEEKVRSKSRYI